MDKADRKKLKPLVQELIQSMQKSIYENEDVTLVVNKIKEMGYELVCEANYSLTFSPVVHDDGESILQEVGPKVIEGNVVPGTFSAEDEIDFLKSFRIKLNQD